MAQTNLKEVYQKEIVAKLMQELGFPNPMQVPKIAKITINMGVGEAANDKKIIDRAVAELTKIAGQKAVATKARKSVASFKIREGWPIGCKVTLRGKKMYDMLHRLVNIVLLRIRDFRGLSKRSFDGQGNYSFGIKEQIVFPEIKYDEADAIRGLDICITTTARTNAEGYALLKAFNFPFRD